MPSDPTPAPEPSPEEPETKKKRGLLWRIWNGVFGGGSEDYAKRLQHLSKEEAVVLARIRRRSKSCGRILRNLIVLSVIAEVGAAVYAIMTAKSLDLKWQIRAIRVLPMFLVPGLAFLMYSTVVSFTRILERKDQKTLERLRAERKAKIDELKESTKYYETQQLIQKYDIDPTAKAAAATVLASKLGSDTGLKVYVGDDTKSDAPQAKTNGVELVPSEGLRNRKQSQSRSNSAASSTTVSPRTIQGASGEVGGTGQEVAVQPPHVVEHYQGPAKNDGGWIARISALLVGEDPSQSYALICGNCHMHNGLTRKEDYQHITYYCPHCHALNTSKQGAENYSFSSRDRTIPVLPANGTLTSNAAAESEESNKAQVPQQDGAHEEKQEVDAS